MHSLGLWLIFGICALVRVIVLTHDLRRSLSLELEKACAEVSLGIFYVLLVIKLFVLQKFGNFDLNNFLPSATTAVIGRFLFRSWFLESALLLEGFTCGRSLLLL